MHGQKNIKLDSDVCRSLHLTRVSDFLTQLERNKPYSLRGDAHQVV